MRVPPMLMSLALGGAMTAMPSNVVAQQRATPPASAATPAPPPSSYADVADFAAESAVIIDARVRKIRLVEAERAPGLPPGMARLYVEADVNGVLFGRDAVARRIAYLVDVRLDARGRPARIGKQRILLFARPITQANQLTLVTTGAQLQWDAGRDATARAIAAELARAPAPPRITGVAQAFHVRGTVEGESETQIFLRTANDSPVSLSIVRRPGQSPRWTVAFGEIVDESATMPARRTLGWYRLACGLPPRLPAAVVAGLDQAEAVAVARDYALVTAGVGACDRTVVATSGPVARP